MKPVCLVMGAGAGIGGHVAQRFARQGYHAMLCRRSDETGLQQLVEHIERGGGWALSGCSGWPLRYARLWRNAAMALCW